MPEASRQQGRILCQHLMISRRMVHLAQVTTEGSVHGYFTECAENRSLALGQSRSTQRLLCVCKGDWPACLLESYFIFENFRIETLEG